MKELHSRDGIPDGETLVISPTEQYKRLLWLVGFPDIDGTAVCNRCTDREHRRSLRSTRTVRGKR